MARTGFTGHGSAWPTPTHELLLRAALSDPDAALAAWTSWVSVRGIEHADAGERRLFPLVHGNLRSHHAVAPERERLKHAFRLEWVRQHLLLAQIADAVARLERVRIRTLILKGAALQTLAYGTHGVRPMDDGDILVSAEDAPAAAVVLCDAGWMPTFEPLARELRCRASTPFTHPTAAAVDLHWHVLYDDQRDAADQAFWTGARPMQLGQVETLTLRPEHHVLHSIAHGLAWSPIPPIRWVADVVRLIRATGEAFAWDELSRLAALTRLEWLVAPGLRYVERLFPGTLPATMHAHLTDVHSSLGERIELYCRMRGRTFSPGYVARFWRHHRRALPPGRYRRGLTGYVEFCCDTLRIEPSWRVPFQLLRELAARSEDA